MTPIHKFLADIHPAILLAAIQDCLAWDKTGRLPGASVQQLAQELGIAAGISEIWPIDEMPKILYQEAARRLVSIGSAAVEVDSGWLPIDTAPKDPTPVDLWRPSWGGERCTKMSRVDLGNGNVFYEPIDYGPSCVRDATYWRPIPSAPKTPKEIAE